MLCLVGTVGCELKMFKGVRFFVAARAQPCPGVSGGKG